MALTFLSLSEILEIHQDQITRYGGTAGVRDLTLLKSATGIPAARFKGEFLHTDISEMASAYIFHIANNHPFIDGNKRTGLVSALVFLLLNGHEIQAPENGLYEIVMKVASGKTTKAELATFFRKWIKKDAK